MLGFLAQSASMNNIVLSVGGISDDSKIAWYPARLLNEGKADLPLAQVPVAGASVPSMQRSHYPPPKSLSFVLGAVVHPQSILDNSVVSETL